MKMNNAIFLSLLSGKGGSGKTVLALSFAKVLSEMGVKVLLVDLDTATHGATYFFESELNKNNLSLSDILYNKIEEKKMLKTEDNFYFIPSTLNPEKFEIDKNLVQECDLTELFQPQKIGNEFQVVIFDCQAGYSELAKKAAALSQQNLVVLEPDAVSSSALRILHLQIGEFLNRSNSWQLFNKLTEEERPIYEKVLGGTLFSSLPPIPFDWNVRASFSTCDIPSITERKSAFGLGVLRIMKIIFKDFRKKLNELERKTGGDWHTEIKDRLKELEEKKANYDFKIRESRYKERLNITRLILYSTAIVGSLLVYIPFLEEYLHVSFLFSKYTIAFLGMVIMLAGVLFHSINLKNVRSDKQREEGLEQIKDIEDEMKKYRTLLTTDPWLKEYSRLDETQNKEDDKHIEKSNNGME